MIAEFHYHVPWRAAGVRPGHHRSVQPGGGFEFQGHVPFIVNPDPRNIDVHATLHDPFGNLVVRTFRQRSTIPVYLIADVSGSMGFHGHARKLEVLATIAGAVAYSAYRTGDPFGFLACDECIRDELTLPPRWHKGLATELYRRICGLKPRGKGARALLEVGTHLGRQRSLVFVVSDFHLPLTDIETLFKTLSRHDVVPVVLWDSAEYERFPRWGLAYVIDPETGEQRRLVLRPALRDRFVARYRERRQELVHLCSGFGRDPFFVVDDFDPDALTRYFLG